MYFGILWTKSMSPVVKSKQTPVMNVKMPSPHAAFRIVFGKGSRLGFWGLLHCTWTYGWRGYSPPSSSNCSISSCRSCACDKAQNASSRTIRQREKQRPKHPWPRVWETSLSPKPVVLPKPPPALSISPSKPLLLWRHKRFCRTEVLNSTGSCATSAWGLGLWVRQRLGFKGVRIRRLGGLVCRFHGRKKQSGTADPRKGGREIISLSTRILRSGTLGRKLVPLWFQTSRRLHFQYLRLVGERKFKLSMQQALESMLPGVGLRTYDLGALCLPFPFHVVEESLQIPKIPAKDVLLSFEHSIISLEMNKVCLGAQSSGIPFRTP